MFWSESSEPDPQQLWADSELYRTLPQTIPSSDQLHPNGFPCDFRHERQHHNKEATLSFHSPAPMGSVRTLPHSEKAKSMAGVIPSIPQTARFTIPLAQPELRAGASRALTPILPANQAEAKAPLLWWGSDHCFTVFGYSTPPGQVSEEQITERLLRDNSRFILQFSNAAMKSTDDALAGDSEEATQGLGIVDSSFLPEKASEATETGERYAGRKAEECHKQATRRAAESHTGAKRSVPFEDSDTQ
ncbi:hypothetical protein BJX99DRAFT_262664 [Aspergillus californicus]